MRWPNTAANADVAYRVHSILRRVLPLWAHSPAVCVALIAGLDLWRVRSADTEPAWGASNWAQRCMARVRDIIGRRRSQGCELSRYDRQAIDAYEAGLAVATYSMDRMAFFVEPMAPFIGSKWSDEQLRRLRHIGLQHGTFIRRGCYGTRSDQ